MKKKYLFFTIMIFMFFINVNIVFADTCDKNACAKCYYNMGDFKAIYTVEGNGTSVDAKLSNSDSSSKADLRNNKIGRAHV